MRPYPPRVRRDLDVGHRGNSRRALAPSAPANQQSVSGVGFRHRAGWYRLDPGDLCLRPRVVGVVDIWRDLSSRDKKLSTPGAAGPRRCPDGQLSPRAGSMSLSQLATSQLGWDFRTLRGGIEPGDLHFNPRVIGVVERWKDFRSGDGNLSSPGAARRRRWPEGKLSPRAGSMSLGQSVITHWDWGFYTLRGGNDPGELCFCPGLLEL